MSRIFISTLSGNSSSSSSRSGINTLFTATGTTTQLFSSSACQGLKNAADKCAFVMANCNDEKTGYVNYLQKLYCAETPAKNIIIQIVCVGWLMCLFMAIGIAAHDFLCVNLNTMATILRLSESVVGVTFLAFGNGAPDMFSTYAAMKIGSGSLAVGELLGAASFIIAVVAGSMAIIRPFKVMREPFLRDGIFFVASISFTLYFVSDGLLEPWECMVMLSLYVIYVVYVVASHWWMARSKSLSRQDRLLGGDTVITHSDNNSTDNLEIEHGDFLTNLSVQQVSNTHTDNLIPNTTKVQNAVFSPNSAVSEHNDTTALASQSESELQQETYSELTRIMRINNYHSSVSSNIAHSSQYVDHQQLQQQHFPHKHSRSSSDSSPTSTMRPSIFGALEFQSVVEKLRRESEEATLPLYNQSGLTNNANYCEQSQASTSLPSNSENEGLSVHGHFPLPRADSQSRISQRNFQVPNLIITQFDEEQSKLVQNNLYGSCSPPLASNYADIGDAGTANAATEVHVSAGESSYCRDSLKVALSPSTPLSISPTMLTPIHSIDEYYNKIDGSPTILNSVILGTLFPSLVGLMEKPWYAKVTSIIAAPWVVLLTLTVPVVDVDSSPKDIVYPIPLSGSNSDKFGVFSSRWLGISQAICAPAAFIFFNFQSDSFNWFEKIFLSGFISLLVLCFAIFLQYRHCYDTITWSVMPFVGFILGVCWIPAIANEVVGLLKAFGIYYSISDAVLGLTVFAIGNSLGDLIANIMIAKMGYQMMALSACFGGPLLNILAGIGFSGLFLLFQGYESGPYMIHISGSLVVSGIAVLATMIFLLVVVPLNGWKMTRTVGVITLSFWVICTTINITLEVT